MYNTDPEWQQNMQMLQAAYDGNKLRDQLIRCIKMCKASHDYNNHGMYILWKDIVDEGPIPIPDVGPGEGGLEPHG